MQDHPDITQHLLKILVVHGPPKSVSILLEGKELLQGGGNAAKACALLLGVMYVLNLAYPKTLRYTFETFQKVLLELDGLKLSTKLVGLKSKLNG